MRVYSWNINGLRASLQRRVLPMVEQLQPDILCLQETRVDPADLPHELPWPAGYAYSWAAAQRKGYSGVATLTQRPVSSWTAGLGIERFDTEGRVLIADMGAFDLYNVYVPNGKASPARLA